MHTSIGDITHQHPHPLQVTRSGLTNACSIAGIMLTTQAVMTEQKREKKPNMGMSAGGMPAGLTM